MPSTEGGRYYLTFGEPSRGAQPEPERSVVLERITAFVNSLASNSVKPSLVVICRSRYSGHTPVPLTTFAEEALLTALVRLFPFRRHDITDLCATTKVAGSVYA